jgi:hypothetical protein
VAGRQVSQLRVATPGVVSEGIDEPVAQMNRTAGMMTDVGSKLLGGRTKK